MFLWGIPAVTVLLVMLWYDTDVRKQQKTSGSFNSLLFLVIAIVFPVTAKVNVPVYTPLIAALLAAAVYMISHHCRRIAIAQIDAPSRPIPLAAKVYGLTLRFIHVARRLGGVCALVSLPILIWWGVVSISNDQIGQGFYTLFLSICVGFAGLNFTR
ncbi:MAG: hypothetical protein ABGZ53_04040 [Fuerstiella sp.]